MNQKEQQSQESREVILEAAIQEFGSYGFLSASTNRMCQRANISKGLLFHYYRTKENLFSGVLERCFADLQRCTEPLQEQAGRALEYIGQFYGARMQFFLSHPYHYRILRESMSNMDGAIGQLLHQKRGELYREKSHLFEQLVDGFPLKDGVDRGRALELMVLVSDHVQQTFMDRIRSGTVEPVQMLQEFQQEHRAMIRMVMLGIFQIPKAG